MKFRLLPFLLPMFYVVASAQTFNDPLWIPPTITGTTFNLELAPSTHQFLDAGPATSTFGFNGDYLGPTLILNQGDNVQLNVTNSIGEPTTVHWHGMHVAPEDDGGPHTAFNDGETWSPEFTVLDHATTFWYHPHLHEHTNDHVSRGAAGMMIIRDAEEAALNLPRDYGVDDIPLVIQSKAFTPDNQIALVGDDNVMMVNGVIDPYVELPARMARLRCLNASSGRVFNLGFDDGRTFFQIGSDGGLLSSPVALDRVMLAPGERVELVVDLGADNPGDILYLMSYASEMPGNIPGGAGGAGVLNGVDFPFLEIRVIPSSTGGVTAISQNLTTHNPWQEAEADVTRTIRMTGGPAPGGPPAPFTLDDAEFDMMNINHTVQLDDIEIWTLTNETNTAHPFHIHDIQFYILDIDGMAPPPNQRGRKDVILVRANSTVRFITQFTDFADPDIPYMYHCHILVHEDDGMMGQFVVVDPTPVQEAEVEVVDFRLSPNPVSDVLGWDLELPEAAAVLEASLTDMLGREVAVFHAEGISHWQGGMDASGLAAGAYTLRIFADGGLVVSEKVLRMP